MAGNEHQHLPPQIASQVAAFCEAANQGMYGGRGHSDIRVSSGARLNEVTLCRLLKEKQGSSSLVRFEKALILAKRLGDKVYERRANRGLAAASRLQVGAHFDIFMHAPFCPFVLQKVSGSLSVNVPGIRNLHEPASARCHALACVHHCWRSSDPDCSRVL